MDRNLDEEMEGGTVRPREDADKILLLLKEYSSKLLVVCNEHAAKKRQASLVLATGMAIASVALVNFMLVFGFTSRSYDIPMNLIYEILGVMALISFFAGLMVLLRQRFSRSNLGFDAEGLALIVTRLIDIASQYREHASDSIGYKFEFDLRLTEAEAALHMCYRVFGIPELGRYKFNNSGYGSGLSKKDKEVDGGVF